MEGESVINKFNMIWCEVQRQNGKIGDRWGREGPARKDLSSCLKFRLDLQVDGASAPDDLRNCCFEVRCWVGGHLARSQPGQHQTLCGSLAAYVTPM